MKKEDLTYSEQMELARYLQEKWHPALYDSEEEIHARESFYARYGKRLLDIALSLPLFAITLPINALLALGALVDVGRPVVFSQTRTGKNGKRFKLKKFRNMSNEKDSEGNLLPADKRLSRYGFWVRKTSLDELLNFWFILKGDMSFIGPRPLMPEYDALYSPRHRARLQVRPGLECPPHNYDGEHRTWQSRLDNDAWYVENISLKTDLKLLVNLAKLALNPQDASSRACGSEVGAFMGYDTKGNAITIRDISQAEVDSYFKKQEES